MKQDIRVPLLFLAPALILLLVFVVVPVVASLVTSLTDFNIFALNNWSKARFVGVQNYVKLFGDELFRQALWNTLYFVAVGVPTAVILSLFFAVLVNRPTTALKNLFRVGYYLPSITDAVAIAIVWRWLLNPRWGILSWALGQFGIQGPNWLGDPRWAMPAIIMLVVWKGLGYNMVIFLAGLQGIPQQYYEAAQIDGAGKWRQLRFVTLPLLGPTTFFVTVMTIIGYLQLFAEPFMLTDGGPLNATLSVVLYMYRQGFKFFNLGYASAMAYVLFAIIFIATLAQMKLKDKDVAY